MTQEEWMQIYDITGAAMEVYNVLGRGMEEAIYQESLERELDLRHIPYSRQQTLHCYYKDFQLDKTYKVDLYINGVIVELKSVSDIISEHRAQLLNYMRITKSDRGMLINYGEKSLRVERYLYLPDADDFVLLTQSNYKEYITK